MAELLAGSNFSGRSAALRERLSALGTAFFIGPYAEAALSGLSSTVADEIAIYAVPEPRRKNFAPLDFADFAARKPPTLSGGEQVLLALHCFSRSDYRAIGIDTALEQLDPASPRRGAGFPVARTASRRAGRQPDRPAGRLVVRVLNAKRPPFPCDLAAATAI
jgi:hypothetical protein